jgi:Leucine-rich repeat (LRR) protein
MNKKYVVYENDLKYKNMRNINPEQAEWYDESVKKKYEQDFDSVSARLKNCKKCGYEYLDLSRLDLYVFPILENYINHDNINYDKLTKIKYLFLNDNKLSSCGDEFKQFKNLEVLDISYNNISNVSSISYLSDTLKEFICTNNIIQELPSLKSLIILDCMTNKIKSLGKYPNLKDLICSENELKVINSYKSLKKLICRKNPLTTVYEQLSLEYLDCSETLMSGELLCMDNINGLICNHTKINNISNLKNLESLEIVGCDMNIPFLKKLKYLLCDDNESIKLSNLYKLNNVISEGGSSLCLVFNVD